MRDTSLTWAYVAGGALAVLACLFIFKPDNSDLAPVASHAPPPVVVIPAGPPHAASLGDLHAPAPTAGNNQRPMPTMYASRGAMVALPDGSGHIRYLPANAPEAVQYLDAQRTAQNNLTFDSAPQNAGTTNLPPPSAFSPRLKRVNVNPGN